MMLAAPPTFCPAASDNNNEHVEDAWSNEVDVAQMEMEMELAIAAAQESIFSVSAHVS
jgi:hypothetical protein